VNTWETYEVTESGSSEVRLATFGSAHYRPTPPSRIRVGFRVREYWLELLPHPPSGWMTAGDDDTVKPDRHVIKWRHQSGKQ